MNQRVPHDQDSARYEYDWHNGVTERSVRPRESGSATSQDEHTGDRQGEERPRRDDEALGQLLERAKADVEQRERRASDKWSL